MKFDRASLEAEGFTGWLTFPDTRVKGAIPTTGGVYVVSYTAPAPVAFLSSNPAKWRDGKDPTVSLHVLKANWIDADVVYIGKANQLRRRIGQFRRYGEGRATNHSGGRLIWQLAEPDKLCIAWKQTPDRVPLEVETEMIATFRREYGKPPFANAPHLLGR
ncbi:MAG: GIY-YIG nuclease family protein [Blastomonas sp.]